MKTTLAFLKKEWMYQVRSGKIFILAGLFILFGLMNTFIAKITPWLMEVLSESLEASGMNIVINEVSALDSWAQFYKNIPMALIAFVLMESDLLASEVRSGTLILALTKGLDRHKVIVTKSAMIVAFWTLGYWLCFAVTYFANMLYWDNGVAQNLMLSGLCSWVYGLFVCGLVMISSAIFGGNILVLACTGGVTFVLSLLTVIPKVRNYLPSMLEDGTSLVYGLAKPEDYYPALIITGLLAVACLVAAVPIFNKKQL